MSDFPYRKLAVYGKSKDYVKLVYGLLKGFPVEERFALCDQLRRSSVSICSNIAEGASRFSGKEEAHFIELAFGSLNESMSQLEIAKDMTYISDDDLSNAEEYYIAISKMLSGLRRSCLNK